MLRGSTPTGMSVSERGMSREGRKGGIIAISTSKRQEENYAEVEGERRSRESELYKREGMTPKELAKKKAEFYAGPPRYKNPRLAAAANGIPPKHFGPSKFTEDEIKQVRKRREESGEDSYQCLFPLCMLWTFED